MGPYLTTPITSKSKSNGNTKELRFTACDMQGWRKTMEDSRIHALNVIPGVHVFGVFDGHGGFEVAKFVEKEFVNVLKETQEFKKQDYQNALIQAFKLIDERIFKEKDELKKIRRDNRGDNENGDEDAIANTTGCTANVLIITPDKFYVANAGDSRSVLSRSCKPIALSEDHKPESEVERSRIAKAGGTISNGRVNGGLNLSRSLGDFFYKKDANLSYDQQLIISKPDVLTVDRSKQDDFIIMGCDGIWQKYVTNNQGMIQKIIELKKKTKDVSTMMDQLLDSLIAKDTSEEVGCDNMTAIMIEFNKAMI